jgi:hypothetical protein
VLNNLPTYLFLLLDVLFSYSQYGNKNKIILLTNDITLTNYINLKLYKYNFKLCNNFRLDGVPYNDFDPVLNKKHLLECVKWCLCCCDNVMETQNETVDELSGFISNLGINKENIRVDRVLMESLYILCNLNDIHPLLRYLASPTHLKRYF